MRAIVATLASLLLLTITAPSLADSNPTPVDGVLVGGITLAANMTGNGVTTFTDSPAIAEVYTSSWCENCPDAEHALAEVSQEREVTPLFFHRWSNGTEDEDPFGTEVGDEWWWNRYGQPVQPIVVLHGVAKHVGTPPNKNLAEEYGNDIDDRSSLGHADGESRMSWNLTGDGVGEVTWDFTPDESWQEEEVVVTHHLFIKEKLANFTGSNDEEHHPDVVRSIINLEGDSGILSVTLPEVWDGDDLELVLVHAIHVSQPSEDIDEDEGFLGLPAISVLLVLSVIAISATYSRKQ